MIIDANLIYGWVLGLVLIMVRTGAWMLTSPPFNSRALNTRTKTTFAFAFTLFMLPTVDVNLIPTDYGPLIKAVFVNIAVGAILGIMTNFLYQAFQSSGEFVDIFGGISINPAFDPTTGFSASGFARIYSNMSLGLIFAIGGHLLVVRGLLRTFDVVAVHATSFSLGNIEDVITRAVIVYMIAAVEIAMPAIAVAFIVEVAQGMVAKAAPQMNVMLALAPLKVGLAILVSALALGMLPHALENLVRTGISNGFSLFGP